MSSRCIPIVHSVNRANEVWGEVEVDSCHDLVVLLVELVQQTVLRVEILKWEVFDVLVMLLTGWEIREGSFFRKEAAWLLYHYWVKRHIEGRFCE